MKNNKPKPIKYIRLFYDRHFIHFSFPQLGAKYNISHKRASDKYYQYKKRYPDLPIILEKFKASDLSNPGTVLSIWKRINAGK